MWSQYMAISQLVKYLPKAEFIDVTNYLPTASKG